MCDKIIKRKLTKKETPKYGYKVVQKVGEGKYVTPVMGEYLALGRWKKAPAKKKPSGYSGDLIDSLKTRFKKRYAIFSSNWDNAHVARWGILKYSLEVPNFVANFVDEDGNRYPKYLVTCELRGDISASQYQSRVDTYLVSEIKVVEEIKLLHTEP